jgi:ribonucleoside-triphosphate reductase
MEGGNPSSDYIDKGGTMKPDTTKIKLGDGVRFERIRRITGYLVGSLDRWNNAKKAEEKDRVKHGMGGVAE